MVVPLTQRRPILEELHQGHPGMVRMKALARSFVWWPGIDGDIEEFVKECNPCQRSRPNLPATYLHPWERPANPWERIHVDYASVEGQNVLILVDAHSKWIEAIPTSSMTAGMTVRTMRGVFATHGVPKVVTSDNGPSFTAHEFTEFLEANGIQHKLSAPYHPTTNGLAERAVQSVKQGVNRLDKGKDLRDRLSIFLLQYRITPQTTTGVSPSQPLMGRRLQTRLDRIFPDGKEHAEEKQQQQAAAHDTNVRARTFKTGQSVFVRDYTGNRQTWTPGTVLTVTGPVSCVCSTGSEERRCHVDQLITRWEQLTEKQEQANETGVNEAPPSGGEITPTEPATIERDGEEGSEKEAPAIEGPVDMNGTPGMEAGQSFQLRRSGRIRHAPDRLSY